MTAGFNHPCAPAPKHKGTVLVVVMLMVAVAALIATDIAYRQKLDVLRTAAFLERDSAFQSLLAAESAGIYVLKLDRNNDRKNFNPNATTALDLRDQLSDEWNQRLAQPLPNGIGTIEGLVVDLQGRFNVNWLFATDQDSRANYLTTFKNVLNRIQQLNPDILPDQVTPNMLGDRLLDWIDPDDIETGLDGKEDMEYLGREAPYRTANHFITDISELLLVEGFTPELLEKLDNYVSFLPPATKLNLLTADSDTLIAFGFSQAQVAPFIAERAQSRFQQDRQKRDYANVKDLFDFLVGAVPGGAVPGGNTNPTGGGVPKSNIKPELFSIRSDYYLVKGKAVINGKPVLIESVIYRPPLDQAEINAEVQKPKVILRKLVDPLKQV